MNDDNEHCVILFDLGGGTLDVSILNVVGTSIEVRSTYGDPYIGGRDFDEKIVQFCI